MVKYHINPDTGNAGKCSATFKCPYGDLERDHYETAAQARRAFEERMEAEERAKEATREAKSAKRLGDPIILPKLRTWYSFRSLDSALDYDYDSSYDHPEYEDVCRCRVISDVKIKGWNDEGEGLAEYARARLDLGDEPLPEELKRELTPFVTNFNSGDFYPEIRRGYYGEELVGIEGPKELDEIIERHYYAQPDAGGPENILTYLRGRGYDTAGEYPLEAIKGALQAENNGRLIAKVERAKKWRTAEIAVSNIKLPSESQKAAGEKDPRALTSPYGKRPPSGEIAGVVLQRGDGSYELIDGYHRLGWLKANGKKRKRYIILSHEDYREPSYYSRNEQNWHGN